jgi:hypothetical protein
MISRQGFVGLALWAVVCGAGARVEPAPEQRVRLEAAMITGSSPLADFSGLVDEQDLVQDPPSGAPKNGWQVPSQHWKKFPFAATLDLGQARHLSALWFYDTQGKGEIALAAGEPGKWKPVAQDGCARYQQWVRLPLDVSTRYLQLELKSPGANFAELALYAFTAEALQARTERAAALQRARAEAASRPVVTLPLFGAARLVDEVDCGAADPGHRFQESPAGASRIEDLLGRRCRVLQPAAGEGSYLAFRLGQGKLLKPGAAYVLALDYPEDQPRSVLVMNGGNETTRGFHTGTTVGDALHPKYVDGHPESLRVPLSGRYETWTLFFHLHDRFPELGFLRGAAERKLTAEDGFEVVVAQFPARDDPTSRGAAVASIRLFEVADEAALAQPLTLPPAPLPHRRICWREEMADGVIQSDKPNERGLQNRLDWYKFKAAQMHFLGINTFTKDLLEFGACQHWDSTPYGGNDWVFFAGGVKDLWTEIVALMGREGFGVLPYYEYAGSKGAHGLGPQRRCQPLTRDDAYTHIKWIESANADITDPETGADFKKMLDLTVLRLKDSARFAGIWLRPRSQLPMSFADATRARFAAEANQGQAVTRANLIADAGLLRRYEDWWFGKRREFLIAMRDHLRAHGLPEALVLYTGEGGEPGVGFPTWEKRLVTDDVAAWQRILAEPQHILDQKPVVPISVERVVQEHLYRDALLAPPLNWGHWEVNHANPPPDPDRYRDTAGVLMTHCINRLYTAAAPQTFDLFRGPAGLAVVRHYALNENMLFDQRDQPKLGYFVADIERAGPYCMLAEAQAVANGDPTLIGYLLGGNLGRGFPQYVREFNVNFLALPALPSERSADACADREVAVRAIRTPEHGTWLAVVNTGFAAKPQVSVRLPVAGAVTDAVTGKPLAVKDGAIELALHPCELRTLRVR